MPSETAAGQIAKALEWAMFRTMPKDVRDICEEVVRLGKDAYLESQRPPAPKLNADWNQGGKP